MPEPKISRFLPLAFVTVVLLTFSLVPVPAQAQITAVPQHASPLSNDPATVAAFDDFYNMQYERATPEFEKILDKHANDPQAINHMVTCLLMHELYKTGAMNSGEYANDTFYGSMPRPADPKVKARIKRLVAQAERLEDRQLQANPNDVQALYARGVTRAAFSVYTALIERAWFSALRNAVGARHDHEHVLELDPQFLDAKLVVGTHNYVTGSLPWTVKVAAALAGLSGSKEKGLRYLREDAEGKTETSSDAKVVLGVFLRRERRYEEALGMMHDLAAQYPGNYLFALEEGNLLRSLARNDEAAAVYRKVWQKGREGKYGRLHYEMGAWSLGELLRSEKDYAGAAAAYEMVGEAPDPEPETLQKANLAAGEMYDLMQKRDQAMKKYQAVLAENGNSPPAEQARKHIRDAYRE